MISVEMLQNMKPEDAARVCDILGRFDCVLPATPCIMCPYQEACRFIDVVYHEMKARSVT